MSHITGEYNYSFPSVSHFWNDADKTGVSKLVIEFKCSFSGETEGGVPIYETSFIGGEKLFPNPVTLDYITENVSEICNSMASGEGWFLHLEEEISGKLHSEILAEGSLSSFAIVDPPNSTTGIKYI